MKLSVVSVGLNSFKLCAVGEIGPDELSFESKLEIGFFDSGSEALAPVPEEIRGRIVSYIMLCDTNVLSTDDISDLHSNVSINILSKETLSASKRGLVQFSRQRRVRYGECSISGKIYMPKLIEYSVEMAGEWYGSCLGISWLEQCTRKRGAPFMNIRCDYLSPIELGQTITMVVKIPRLGSSSIDYEVMGYYESGVLPV